MKKNYIIFADDDADVLELITGYFKQYNNSVDVLEFMNGYDVMQFLEQSSFLYGLPLLVVLDIEMPRLNGKETLLAIRQHSRYKNIPVVMYSTSHNRAEEEFCNANGASWVIKSPGNDSARQIAKVLAEFCELQKH